MSDTMFEKVQTGEDIREIQREIELESRPIAALAQEINKVIVGQETMVESLLVGLLGNGHVLLEGVPGLAKTLAIKTLAQAVEADFSRIQFTPDLLPADVVGTLIFNIKENEFNVKKGPIFANFVLADEINRAPAKVQSALLEAMQEKQVTIGDETFSLKEPFLVLATQNPVDQEGTYPLPEAQVDRFMLKVLIDYPNQKAEQDILRMHLNDAFEKVQPMMSADAILRSRTMVKKVYLDDKIADYIIRLVNATRNPSDFGIRDLDPLIEFGASPRGSINLGLASRVLAFLNQRAFVIPEDVRYLAKSVLRHRIGLSYEAEAEEVTADQIIGRVLERVDVP